MLRVCRKCGEEKDISMFVSHKQCKHGKSHECKSCKDKSRVRWAGGKVEYDRQRYERRKLAHQIERSERNHIYKMRSYIGSDKKKGLAHDIDEDFCLVQMSKPCYYCSHIDTPINGLDRIDNSIGHIKTNLIPCCQLCNMTRGNRWSHEDFKNFVSPGIIYWRSKNDARTK